MKKNVYLHMNMYKMQQSFPSHTLLSVLVKYNYLYFSLFTHIVTFGTHCSVCSFVT